MSEGIDSSLLGTFDESLSGFRLGRPSHRLAFVKECPHASVDEDSAVEDKHDCHALDSWVHLLLASLDLAEESVEGAGLVDVGVEDQVVSCLLEEVFPSASGSQVPAPEGSFQVESRVLLQAHEHLGLELLVVG